MAETTPPSLDDHNRRDRRKNTRKKIGGTYAHAHSRSDPQDPSHLLVSEGVGSPLFGDRVRPHPRSFSEPRLSSEKLGPSEMVDDVFIGHEPIISAVPIIAIPDLSEAERYDIATIEAMSVGDRIKEARKARGLSQAELGDAIGVRQSTISEMEAGKLKSWPLHASKIMKVLGQRRSYFEPDDEVDALPELPIHEPTSSYVGIEVLPTFAGMGGGGTGDGDSALALLPRRLVEDELRARAEDLLMIDLRGNSMEPLFFHGDQVLVDKRDRNPVQPGPFALWDGDGYVVKNVERVSGKYRIFSSNPIYSDATVDPDQIQIMGRPVWCARRL